MSPRAVPIAAALVLVALLGGCLGSDSERPGRAPSASAGSPDPSVTVRCEDIETRAGWRRQATHVGDFGLLALELGHDVRRNRNGDYLAKMGAVVAGAAQVTLRVPRSERERVRLAYGGVREATPLPEAPVEAVFVPCPGFERSGYVGGLLLDSISSAVTLEVKAPGSPVKTLTIPV